MYIKRVTLEKLEIFETSIKDEEWEKLYERIRKSFEIYLKNINFKQNIRLSFPNLRDISLLYCEGNEIKINKKFITYITYYLFEDSKKVDSLIFGDIDNENVYNETLLLLRELMIEFVILHEFFHIKRNHLEIKGNITSSVVDMNIEFDADKQTIEYLFSKYFFLINKYGIEKYHYLVEKFIYAILHLVNIVIYLENKEFNPPSTINEIRVVFLMASIIDLKRKNPNSLNISILELEKIKNNCVSKFFNVYSKLYDLNQETIEYVMDKVPCLFQFLRKNDKILNN